MKCLTLLLSLVVFLARPALADTSSSSDTKDEKTYGNCHVQTKVDMLTDEVSHHLLCMEDSLTDRTLISVGEMRLRNADRFIVTLSKGFQPTFSNHISVAIRIDKESLIRREARWDGTQYAFIDDASLALTLLEQLAKGQRVAIQVGKERGHIRLNGSAKAIRDFKRRAGLIYQTKPRQETLTPQERQTLEIPARQF